MAASNTLREYRDEILTHLSAIENKLADAEQAYLQADHSQQGTVVKGFDGFLSSKEAMRKRQRTWKPEDRLFSLSSKSSPVTKEMENTAYEGNAEAVAPGGFGKKGYAQKGYAQKDKR